MFASEVEHHVPLSALPQRAGGLADCEVCTKRSPAVLYRQYRGLE